MLKDTIKLRQLSTSFQLISKSFSKGFESGSAHLFKCIEKSSVDYQFETNTPLVGYKQDHKVTNKIYFMHQFNFLCNFYQSMCPIPIQDHVHC